MSRRNQQEPPPLSPHAPEAGLRSRVLPVRRALGLHQKETRLEGSFQRMGVRDAGRPYLEFWVPLLWPDLHSLQAPCLTYRVDASGAVKSSGLTLLSPMGGLPVSVLQTQGALPLQPIPFHVLKIRRPVCPTNQLGGVFECLLEASWACATKKLLDAEGHLAGPAENPLRVSGQRTLTKAMSTGHIFCQFYWLHKGRRQRGWLWVWCRES